MVRLSKSSFRCQKSLGCLKIWAAPHVAQQTPSAAIGTADTFNNITSFLTERNIAIDPLAIRLVVNMESLCNVASVERLHHD